MPTQTFTSGNDSFIVRAAGTYDLSFLAGEDSLTVIGGTFTTAHMGDDDDLASLRSGDASVFGELGNDRFEIYANGVEADGGDGSDLFNLRGGSGQSVNGGIGVDRFNIYAGITNVLIHGGADSDDFFGYFHSVTGSIFGDSGDDYFVQFIGGVTINGGTGDDIFRADAADPAAFVELAGEGVDSVQVARGASYTLGANVERISVQGFHGTTLGSATLTGNALDNTINAHVNVETIYGLGGNDRISAKAGADTLDGGDGDDFLDGGGDNDIIIGGTGNDTLQGRTGDDTMTGGTGDDTYYVDSLADVVTEASDEGTDIARVSVSGYTLTDNIETGIVFGSAGIAMTGNGLDNLLIGNAGNDSLVGGDGNDSLSGGGGDDLLSGGAGSDVLNGGAGDDQLSAGGDLDNDVMSGGMGDDSYGVLTPADTVVELANAGIDTVTCLFNAVLMTAYTLPSFVENGTIDPNSPAGGILNGNALDNVLTGGNKSDVLDGLAGDDVMSGGLGIDSYMVDSAGDVVIEIGGDIDYVYVSIPNYTLTTGVENGTLTVAGELDGNASNNVLEGSGGNDILYGFAGNDTFEGNAGNDQLFGGDDNDDLSGEAGHDTINGGSGSDMVHGGNGDDMLSGEINNDALYGDDGADRLDGGLGADLMFGGIGTDTFRYTESGESPLGAFDTIGDFFSGTDKIDLSAIDANTTVAGDQAFTYNPLGGKGTVLWLPSGDGYDIFADVDGGGADFKIHVVTSGLVTADFVL